MGLQTISLEGASPAEETDGQRHSLTTIVLHWSTVLALVIGVGAVLWREVVEQDALRATLLSLHRQAGNFVFVALVLRLATRFGVGGFVDQLGTMPAPLRWAAHLSHAALYLLLFALPLLGLAASNAHGVTVYLFGLVALPPLAQADADLADSLTDYHLWASWCLLALVTMHVAAAIWHHRVRRDGVLAAMLPGVQRR